MARKSFRLVKDLDKNFCKIQSNEDIKWTECLICQEHCSKEKLISPVSNNHKLDLRTQYSKLIEDIRRFKVVGTLTLYLQGIVSLQNIETLCFENKAVYHKRCKNRYDDYHFERYSKKRKLEP